jgi:prepilin-type N-terminal cleavage/methylation domain-containing protein
MDNDIAMNTKGFTLIELVMVMVLIGILAAIIVPRMPSVTGTKSMAFADKLRADIRYAQDLAMTRGARARVDFSVANQYSVLSSQTGTCSFTTTFDPSTGGPFLVTVNTGNYAGITLTRSINCLEYNSLGIPYDCSGVSVNACSSTLSGMLITISTGGTVSVASQTGAVN